MVSLNKQSIVKKLMFYSHSFFFNFFLEIEMCSCAFTKKFQYITTFVFPINIYFPRPITCTCIRQKESTVSIHEKCFFLKDVDIRWIHCLFKHISYNIYYSIVYHWNFIPEHQNLYLIVHRVIFASIETVLFRLEFDYTELFLQRYYLRPSNLPSILFTR